MFTAKPQKNRAAATAYFDEHLSHNDYYAQNEVPAGHWIGQGAERMGLNPGEVSPAMSSSSSVTTCTR